MKRCFYLAMVVLMSIGFAACDKKNEPAPTPDPTPDPGSTSANDLTVDYEFLGKLGEMVWVDAEKFLQSKGYVLLAKDPDAGMYAYGLCDEEGRKMLECVCYLDKQVDGVLRDATIYRNYRTPEQMKQYVTDAYAKFGSTFVIDGYTLACEKGAAGLEKVDFKANGFNYDDTWSTKSSQPDDPNFYVAINYAGNSPEDGYKNCTSLYVRFSASIPDIAKMYEIAEWMYDLCDNETANEVMWEVFGFRPEKNEDGKMMWTNGEGMEVYRQDEWDIGVTVIARCAKKSQLKRFMASAYSYLGRTFEFDNHKDEYTCTDNYETQMAKFDSKNGTQLVWLAAKVNWEISVYALYNADDVTNSYCAISIYDDDL